MESFKVFFEQQEFVDFVINEFDQPVAHKQSKTATKDQILKTWKELQPNTPIYITPLKDGDMGGEHSSYGEDGVRISGSWAFIASVLARLKEMLSFENEETILRLAFRDVQAAKGGPPGQSYVFYINLEKRTATKQPKLPKLGP